VIAYLSEFSSTRTGFPYGWYVYTESTRGEELFISNVPFMDSLSYTFLLFAAYQTALVFLSTMYKTSKDVQLIDTFSLRQSWRTALLTAAFMMMLDVVIDPVAYQGEKWFLGKIYHYVHEGHYFGVPLSNAGGWFLVGLVATRVYQSLERRFFSEGFQDRGLYRFRYHGLTGVGLYYGVLLFNMAVTAYIQDWHLLFADAFIYLLPTLLLVLRLTDPHSRATQATLEAHRQSWGLMG